MREAYQPKAYWEERLSSRPLDVAAVGHIRLGLAYNQWLYRGLFRALRRALARMHVPVSGASVLDVGVGSGAFIPFWRERGVASITGLDITEASVGALRGRYPQDQFLQCDISAELPSGLEGRFDLATAFAVLFHIMDDAGFSRALANLSRALRPGGWALLSDCFPPEPAGPFHHEYYRTHDHYAGELKRAGLEAAGLEPVYFLMAQAVYSRGIPFGFLLRPFTRSVVRLVGRLARHRGTRFLNHIVGATLYVADGALCRLSTRCPSVKILLAQKG